MMWQTRHVWLSFVALLLEVVPRNQGDYAVVNSLVPPVICFQGRHDAKNHLSKIVGAVSNYAEPDSENKQNKQTAARTLYDILGASPNDSQRTLKLKYNNLAKKLHPDARIGLSGEEYGDAEQMLQEFRDVIAAWKVLSDPKQRMRYDRSLRAKEFTENLEGLVDVGIRNAIPFLRKTANVGKRMQTQQRLFDLERKYRDLEQRAGRENSRAIQMKTQLDTLYNKRLQILSTSNSDLTSAEAARILQGFKNVDTKGSFVALDDYIAALKEIETDYINKEREQNDIAQAVRTAQETLDNAQKSEKRAVLNLAGCVRTLNEERRKLQQSFQKALDLTDEKQQNEMYSLQILEDSFQILDTCTCLDESKSELSMINDLMTYGSLENFIVNVNTFESDYKIKINEWNYLADAVRVAQQAADKALQSERRALQQLEDARREVAQARIDLKNSIMVTSEVNMQDMRSRMELEKVLTEKERLKEQVRARLQQKEGQILDTEANYLSKEISRLEDLEKVLLAKAQELRMKAEELKINF